MDIRVATKHFEKWLGGQVTMVRGDLRHKHIAMGADQFSFLRATYYRWAQQFMALEDGSARAPKVLAVGDLHLENFGTWRDGLGRLAWGINDFDETYPLPYTNDLVRLATSALLAIEVNHLRMRIKDACQAIIEGYREGLEAGGRPFIIGDEHRWFKPILDNPQRDPGLYWDRLRKLPREKMEIPAEAKAMIVDMLPDPKTPYDLHHRIAGLGNLGKPRFTALAEWQGGPVAREVKALTLSAAAWAQSATDGPYFCDIIANAVRAADPFWKGSGPWIVRRISPDCRRLEIACLRRVEDKEWLLHAMGFETANVHLGTSGVRKTILRHLADFQTSGLRKAAISMHESLAKDFRRWHKGE